MTTMMVIDYLAKWGHFLAGTTWIGLLYYFNFVQTEYFKEADADARTDAFVKLAPRALWWFRWGAMLTLITGLIMLLYRHRAWTVDIVIGSVMAILMFLNVWLIIWPNQKILIASNERLKGGGEALPEAAAAAPKAALASRTNTLFSIPMLYFMGSTSANLHNGSMGDNMTALIIILIIIAAVELNAIFGKPGPIATIKGVITSGFVLWAVVLGLLLILPKSSSAPAAEPAATVEPAPTVEAAPAMPTEEPPPMLEAAPAEEPAAMDAAAPVGEAAAGEGASAMDEAVPAPEAAPPPAADPVADPDPTG